MSAKKRPAIDDPSLQPTVDPLLTLLEIPPTTDPVPTDFHQTQFRRIAESLLNDFTLVIKAPSGDVYYRLVEIEFYLKDTIYHDDPFTHGQPQQSTCGEWYFHRRGNAYVGGTYKGLDITFGRTYTSAPSPYFQNQPPPPTAIFRGGILIRSIARISSLNSPSSTPPPKQSIIEGPCRCVETIMEHLECKTLQVKDLVDVQMEGNISALPSSGSFLYLQQNTMPDSPTTTSTPPPTKRQRTLTTTGTLSPSSAPSPSTTSKGLPVYETPRIGLYLRPSHENLSTRITYVTRPYRFLTAPLHLLKSRGILVAGLLKMIADSTLPGNSNPKSKVDTIQTLTGVQAKLVEKCCKAFDLGVKKSDPARFVGDKLGSAERCCEFVGCVEGWVVKERERGEEEGGEEVEE
ncbi:hypothetical protein HDV00_008149 [Rhizophlyctis rosea]|nr:hypothetical protein HDV00_008149 [Rhizophlyctis rosea]